MRLRDCRLGGDPRYSRSRASRCHDLRRPGQTVPDRNRSSILDKYKLSMRQIADAVKSNIAMLRCSAGARRQSWRSAVGLIQTRATSNPSCLTSRMASCFRPRHRPRPVGTLPDRHLRMNQQRAASEGRRHRADAPLENPSEVLQRIRAAVEEINAPVTAGRPHRPLSRPHRLVHKTLQTSRAWCWRFPDCHGGVFLFLLNLRAALLTALIVRCPPICSHLHVCHGISLSLLSIGALDFGIIVDGTIVMVECILRHLAQSGEPAVPNWGQWTGFGGRCSR